MKFGKSRNGTERREKKRKKDIVQVDFVEYRTGGEEESKREREREREREKESKYTKFHNCSIQM